MPRGKRESHTPGGRADGADDSDDLPLDLDLEGGSRPAFRWEFPDERGRWPAPPQIGDRVVPVGRGYARPEDVESRSGLLRRYRRPGDGARRFTVEFFVPVDPVEALPVLTRAIAAVEAMLGDTAREAAATSSWAAVGRSLGISRQSARQRFGDTR